ncbi:MAG: HAD-IIB family hydrolase [Hyphomicrobiales bacterium]|nr:HAD-IIB family hydrolase [Hyphomicrobiales bacterium]
MYISCLATDYDGTLAHDSIVDDATADALIAFRRSGRRLLLVTGRELPDLLRVFPRIHLFDRVVAENGALLFDPATKKETPLAPEPPPALVETLRKKGVAPLSVGRSIIATWEPNEKLVLDAIREHGLELQIVFNKGAVMVLPAGVNKASGLQAALEDLGLSAHNVVSVGDAENDHAFLQASGYAVAVANALPAIKDEADLITTQARGTGVAELIEAVLKNDVDAFHSSETHNSVEVGLDAGDRPIVIRPHGGSALICGSSGGGKSTVATALLERIVDGGYQICVFDPEGDYAEFRSGVVFGDAKSPPQLAEVVKLLERPDDSFVINMLAVPTEDRPALLSDFIAAIANLRAKIGRPHWVLMDEAHHLLPAERDVSATASLESLPPVILVTVDPATLAVDALGKVDDVFAVGDKAAEAIASFAKALSVPAPELPRTAPSKGEALFWRRSAGREAQLMKSHAPAEKAERHVRKYAQGELGEDKSFYFRGPANALNLRAQNLTLFMQMADGVDDDTWLHHLQAHDYSRWIREAIKDDELADELEQIEDQRGWDPKATRRCAREAIERKYTAPASAR